MLQYFLLQIRLEELCNFLKQVIACVVAIVDSLLAVAHGAAQQQFGWLLDAFKYGTPPHDGLAYGLDRWVSLFAGLDSIRDCIAFPKNNSGRDTMIDAPSVLEPEQLTELNIVVDIKEK